MTEEWIYDLFISYAEADKAWVEGYLIDALEKSNVRCHSEVAFLLGVPHLEQIEKGIRQSKRTLLVISPAYLADLASENRFTEALAFKRDRETSIWSVIPLIRHPVSKLEGILGTLDCLKATNETEQEVALERLCQELQVPLPSLDDKPSCPYLGINPFGEENHELFFGRKREVEEIIQRLRFHPFLTIIGSSGSGKSSLAFAGVLPKLKQSELFGSRDWLSLALRPGETPLMALQSKLESDLTDVETAVNNLLRHNQAQNLMLIVDQFEELFTVARSKEIEPFQILLKQLSQIPNCYVILTVRADFYEDLMLSPLWTEIRGHRLEILPLDEEELKQAIINPADVVGVYIESALLERLIADALGASKEPGVLSLLQVTLEFLWEGIERRFLPLSAYENLAMVLPRSAYGTHPTGLQVAITRLANEALAQLTPTQEVIARRIFLRLIQFGQGRPDTRRQQPIKKLQSMGENSQDFQKTIDTLVQYRLLTVTSEEDKQGTKVDISHDIIINGWPVLQEWIQERKEAEQTRKDAEQIRRNLDEKAKEWERLGKQNGGLLDEIELGEADEWLSSPGAIEVGYGEDLFNFVEASRTAIRKRKKNRRFLIGGVISVILLSISIATGFEIVRRGEQIIALYDRWSGLISINSESLEESIKYLKQAKAKAEKAESEQNIDRAIAYTSEIHAETSRLLQEISNSTSTPTKEKEKVEKLRKNSEESLNRLITNYRIEKLRDALSQESQTRFRGVIKPGDERELSKGAEQFPDGSALQITYKILMDNFGAKADINIKNSLIDDKIEAYQIPCATLEQIHELWKNATRQPCGWYSCETLKEIIVKDSGCFDNETGVDFDCINQQKSFLFDGAFQYSSGCTIFYNSTLFFQIFYQSSIAIDRFKECQFLKDDLQKVFQQLSSEAN